MPFFFIEVAVSIFYAFANLVIGWSGIALLICALVGALLRRHFDRESAIVIGRIAAGLILALDSLVQDQAALAGMARRGA